MDSRSHRHSCRGITLLEMLTVMGIVAILMAIAMPSYKYVTNANRIAAEINGLLGDMQYARGEAIKEGQPITVCISNDGATCAVATTWQSGWIVFTDVNGNQQVNAAAGDTVLRVQSKFTSPDTFISNTVGAVTFNREGFASSGAGIATGALITLHASPANSASTRCLSLTMVGLMTVLTYNTTANSMTCL